MEQGLNLVGGGEKMGQVRTLSLQLKAVSSMNLCGFWAEGKRSSQEAADTGGESCDPFPRGLQEVKPLECLETERSPDWLRILGTDPPTLGQPWWVAVWRNRLDSWLSYVSLSKICHLSGFPLQW